MPRVLLLMPSATYRAPDFLAAAERLGVEVVVGSDYEQPLEGLTGGATLSADFRNPAAGARRIETFAAEYALDAIVAVDDAGCVLAALASDRLRLPHNAVAAVEAARNKHLFRRRLAAAGLPTPHFRTVALNADPHAAAAVQRFPCVLKPLALAASRGVIRADDPEEFVAAFERIGALLARPDVAAECGGAAREILVEGYIPGEEVSLEGLLEHGDLRVLALFDKPDPLEGPYFGETIYLTPSRLPDARQDEVAQSAERAARALGLRHGPVHAELRLNDAGIWPVEIAARSIGGLCSRTLTFGAGVSLEELLLQHAIAAPIASFARERRPSGVMMLPVPGAGTLRAVHGLERARAVPGVEAVTITAHVGRELEPLPEGGVYPGFIFAKGDTPAAVERALRDAAAALTLEIAP